MGDDPMALLGLEGALKHYYYYYYYYALHLMTIVGQADVQTSQHYYC
jgi:hypothetical protein